jgi:polysaccharide deacetylase 2 family uncharacterized protein YibQ
MQSDLHAPLGLKMLRRKWWARIPFGLIGVVILGGTGALVWAWVTFMPDPFGGQPVAVVRVDRAKTGIGLKDIGVAVPSGGQPSGGNAHGAPAGPGGGDAASHGGTAQGGAVQGGTAQGGEAEPGRPTPPPAAVAPQRRIGVPNDGQPLPATLVARVTDTNGKYGPLPKIAPDGTRPLEVYARPAPRRPASSPRVVVVVGGLGLSQTGTQEALRQLGPEVTLAFAPYGSSLDRWVTKARQDGHEILLQVPMEPFDYPDSDPGPQTLLTSARPEENLDRLTWLMSRFGTYVGVVNYMGGRFTASEETLQPVMREVANRGLMYLDDGSSSRSVAVAAARPTRTPFAQVDMVLDVTASEMAIDARLAQLESLARQKGLAIGIASALPVSVRRIAAWAKDSEARGILIVPVSAAVRDQQG